MRFLLCLIYILGFVEQIVSAQEKLEFSPYTIDATYQKLKIKYPFVSPIEPLVSKKICYYENVVYKNIRDRKLKVDVYLPNKKSSKTLPGAAFGPKRICCYFG